MPNPSMSDCREMDKSGLILSPMRRPHLPDVLGVEHASFTNPWRLADFDYALDREGSHCLVAHLGDFLVGYSVGFFVLAELHLADLAVHPECRGAGIGGRLLEQVLLSLEERPVDFVTLEVRASNQPAIGLYRSGGFQTVAMRKDYYRFPTEDALVMIRAMRGSLSDWTTAGRWS